MSLTFTYHCNPADFDNVLITHPVDFDNVLFTHPGDFDMIFFARLFSDVILSLYLTNRVG